MMTFVNTLCITLLCSASNKSLITNCIGYILYSPLCLNNTTRKHLTIIITQNTSSYNITTATNQARIINGNHFMGIFCFSSNNRKFMYTIFILIHLFVIGFIFSSLNRFYMRCSISACIISIWEFRLVKYLSF